MVRRGVLLLAAIMAGVLLVGGLGFEDPAAAQRQVPEQQGVTVQTPDRESATGVTPGSPAASRLLHKAEREGSIRVIVGLGTDFVPEGRLSSSGTANQRDDIRSAAAGLRAVLAGTGYRTLRAYDTVPYIALELTPEAFREVQRSPRVTTIQEDVAVPADLEESSPVVQAPTMWASGFNGAGKTIAILDTGVDMTHPFFGGRVVEEACYSRNSNCPNGEATQTGTGAGVPCTYAPEGCEHGTHVAGIAAGAQGPLGFSGVAPRANIMAVQVFSRRTGTSCDGAGEDPCVGSFVSDQIAGLERVFERRSAHTFSAVNLSLGSGMNTSACDTDARKAAIDNLRSADIATVISSGNSGFTNAVGAPGCISSAITVGSTTKPTASAGESIATSSNMSSLVDLLAPGVGINSSIPGGGFEGKGGTSMAAPHVAGAWAVLEQRDPGQTVASNLSLLQNAGTPVTDNRTGGTVTAQRINIADAANVRPTNDRFDSPVGFGDTATFRFKGVNGAATRESGEPDHLPAGSSLGENSVWYSWRAPASGQVFMDTCTSSFDTVLAVYTGGTTFSSLTQVASDDDACDNPNGSGSRISFDAVNGTIYRIAISGFPTDTTGEGTFTLDVDYTLPPNDNFADAQPITRIPASVSGRNTGATRESVEPDHWPPQPTPGEHSVWYSWTAPSSGRVTMSSCPTAGQISVLAAYTGGSLGSLNQVASDGSANACGWGSEVTFDAETGTNYKIAVAGYHPHNEFTFTLNVSMQTPTDIVTPPEAHYQFRNSRASSVGGAPALTDIGPGTNTFTNATVDGASSTVLRFPKGNGLRLSPTTGVVTNRTYTIVALFEFDLADTWRRVLDFKNGASESGLYLDPGNRLNFYQARSDGTGVAGASRVPANTYSQVVLTRNSAGNVAGYVDGVQQFFFADTANRAVIDANDALRFFRDNESGGLVNEHSAGSAARIRLYDSALTAEQVSALDRLDTTPPAVTTATPSSNATGVAPAANVTATFTEPMRAGHINTTNVRLRKVGETSSVPATVTYVTSTNRALLNPSANLEAGATYVVTVMAGARDLAGNMLDQHLGLAGNQPKTWKFTVRR